MTHSSCVRNCNCAILPMLYLNRRTQLLPLIRSFVGKKQPFAFVPTILPFNNRAVHHKRYQSSQLRINGLHAAKTDWKSNKCIAQSNALGTIAPLFYALKEQKEDERSGTSLAPFALTARQLVNYRLPMVLPWAIFLLRASPRLCSKSLTGVQCLEVLSCGLRPAIVRNRLLVYNG